MDARVCVLKVCFDMFLNTLEDTVKGLQHMSEEYCCRKRVCVRMISEMSACFTDNCIFYYFCYNGTLETQDKKLKFMEDGKTTKQRSILGMY